MVIAVLITVSAVAGVMAKMNETGVKQVAASKIRMEIPLWSMRLDVAGRVDARPEDKRESREG